MKKNLSHANAKMTPTKRSTAFITQTEAKNRFLAHCRNVIKTGGFVCVKDQSREAFLTLTPLLVKSAFVTVSAQFFKDNFARCSSLIRDGITFRLTLRCSNEVVYARRHTSYRDPLDTVIDEWRKSIVEAAMADSADSADSTESEPSLSDVKALLLLQASRSEEDREMAIGLYKKLVAGITRMSIGHRPFDEGLLPDQRA